MVVAARRIVHRAGQLQPSLISGAYTSPHKVSRGSLAAVVYA